MERAVLERRGRPPAPLDRRSAGRRIERVTAVGENLDERMPPVFRGEREAGRGGREAARADGGQPAFVRAVRETDRLCDVQRIREPLERELRTVGDLAPAEDCL